MKVLHMNVGWVEFNMSLMRSTGGVYWLISNVFALDRVVGPEAVK
jgi:hypothetical protein